VEGAADSVFGGLKDYRKKIYKKNKGFNKYLQYTNYYLFVKDFI
jgi:hypothetical protein